MPDAVPPRLLLAQHAALTQVGDHARLGILRGQTGVTLPRRRRHPSVEADHGDLLEAVTTTDLEVVRVMARRDLERARAHVRIDVLVADDRHLALDQRHDRAPPDQVLVALVAGIDGDRGVAEQGRRAHGRDGHVATPTSG